MKNVQTKINRVAIRNFNPTGPTIFSQEYPFPILPGVAHMRLVTGKTRKLPSGHYVKMDLCTSHLPANLPDGIYRLMGGMVFPRF